MTKTNLKNKMTETLTKTIKVKKVNIKIKCNSKY